MEHNMHDGFGHFTSTSAAGLYYLGLMLFIGAIIYVLMRVQKLNEKNTAPMVMVVLLHLAVMAGAEVLMGLFMAGVESAQWFVVLGIWAQAFSLQRKAKALDAL